MSDQLPTTTLDGLDPAGALAGNNIIYTQDAEGNDQKATMQQVKDFVKPDAASINNDGIVNTAAQAFSGKKTFTSGLAATSSEISGNESVGGNLNVEGEITQNGQPLITDVKISEQEGNAIEKKEDGLYVSQAAAGLPIGTVILNPCDVVPAGFLKCDGSTYLKADYPELYAKLSAIYILDAISFKVPDYRDRVPQGANGNLNDLIAAGLPNITGAFSSIGENRMVKSEGALKRGPRTSWRYGGATASDGYSLELDAAAGETDTNGNLKTDESTKVYGKSNTVQPPAIAQDFIIKATNYAEPEEDVIDDSRTTTGNVWSAAKTAAEIENVNNKNNYSTEETVIGTYLDKPLYRKVLPARTITTNWQAFTTGNNIKYLINYSVVLGSENRNGAQLQVRNNNGNIEFARYNDENITNAGIVIEYTKTTD